MSKKNNLSILPLATGAVAYAIFLRPQMKKWGTKLGESQRRLPGDEHIPVPNFQMTHAIDIAAPPTALWPWFAQMGREHTGYYGLDQLTNQSIPSVTFIRQDIPAPEIGMALDGGYHLMTLESNHQFLFGGFNLHRSPGITQDVTALYLLEHRREESTRLIMRHRARISGMMSPLYMLVYELVYFVAAWQQLRTLKHHAERKQQ